MNDKPLVIYHGNCADGFTAAWAVWKRPPDADFVAGVYQTPPPDVTGRDVVFVDFCYKRAVMVELAKQASGILVLDHHKSAAEDMVNSPPDVYRVDQWLDTKQLTRGDDSWEHFKVCCHMDVNEGGYPMIYAAFDMARSGAGIAWDFFHPKTTRPAFVSHVEDRDLWKFELPFTREIQAAIFSYAYSFEQWDCFADDSALTDLITGGAAIERKHHKDIAELLAVCQRRMVIGGYDVPVASLPYTLTSDAGHVMASKGEPFAACYWDTAQTRIFSLRSTDDGMDVSAIAKQYGGGGHRAAAGFAVPRDHELARA